MESATKLAKGATSRDPAIGLRSVFALKRLLDRLENLQVDNARDAGWTWPEIAAALNVTKQAVHQKHAARRQNEGKDQT